MIYSTEEELTEHDKGEKDTDDLLKVAKEFALRLAHGPSVSIELQKRLTYEGLKTTSVESQMAHEDFAQHTCYQTEDTKEGVASFLQKREPHFKGG